MFPFIHIGPHSFSSFFFMIAIGILACMAYAIWQGGRRGLSRGHLFSLSLFATGFGLIGMRLFHVLVEAPGYYLEHPSHVFHLQSGGFVSWGAIIGVLVAIAIYMRVAKISMWRTLDVLALGFPLILFFVHVGCLGAGCCYGKPTDFPIYIVFTNPQTPAAKIYPGMPLHATELYAMANAIVLFIGLHLAALKKRFPGAIIALFCIGYGLLRGTIEECTRGDLDRGVYGGWISTGQLMSLFLIAFGVGVYLRFARFNEKN